MENIDLLIKNGWVVMMDTEKRILSDIDIAITEDKIFAIGLQLEFDAKVVIDASQHAVLPGLVDAHMHETLTRGICEDLPLDRWLEEICFPLDRNHSYEFIHAAAMMNQFEMIRGGITTFIDIYRFPEASAEVCEVSGLRGIFSPQIIIHPEGVGETIESTEEFVNNWNKLNPRITPAFGPHASYSCPPEAYTRISQLAEKYDVPIHTHLAETMWEVNTIKEQYGCTPAEYLDRAGVLSSRLSAAHAVHLSEEDIGLIAERDVGLVYNPSSNMKLASGVAPVPQIIAAGIRLGLGTDSNLSNNNLDMFEEMRLGTFLQKLSNHDATILPCGKMLEMATIGSAKALNMDHIVGSIEVGKQADLILIDLNQAHLLPLISNGKYMNLIEQLVYSATAADVTHTIVAGRVLMEDRRVLTLDINEIKQVVNEATIAFLKKAGLVK